jgi:hypothetical protein
MEWSGVEQEVHQEKEEYQALRMITAQYTEPPYNLEANQVNPENLRQTGKEHGEKPRYRKWYKPPSLE